MTWRDCARGRYPASETYRDQWGLADGSVWDLGPAVPFGRYYELCRKLVAIKKSSPDYVNNLGSGSGRKFIAHGETLVLEDRKFA